jgi:hypothetical protein
MTSTILKRTANVENYAIYEGGRGVANADFRVLREFIAPPGTRGFNIERLCNTRFREKGYFLMPKGLRTEIVDVTVEYIVRGDTQYKIWHTVERILTEADNAGQILNSIPFVPFAEKIINGGQ